jgi:glyoxylase-like metal-dependent hydrolase (beta-lactamase superfamily II)
VRRVNGWRCLLAASTVAISAACTHNIELVPPPPQAAATTTGGPWSSMIFAARTDSGVLVIDLGWGRAARGLEKVLSQIGARPADVRWAFITHAHRDHIGAWTSVPQATFVLGRDEVPLFTGTALYKGFAPRMAQKLKGYARPKGGEVSVRAVGSDTLFVLGRDTLRAYGVPGHTPGSTVYLFRETLFVGDAANWSALRGFRGTLTVYSDDVEQSHRSMQALLARVDASGVRWRTVCTAHGKCAVVDSALKARITK